MIDLPVLRAIVRAGATGVVVLAAVEAMMAGNPASEAQIVQTVASAVDLSVTAVTESPPNVAPIRPLSGAERTRRWRARSVTAVTGSSLDVTPSLSLFPSLNIKEERKKERKPAVTLPGDWVPSQRHIHEGRDLGFDETQVRSQAEDMRLFAQANEHTGRGYKSNWNAYFSSWLRRNARDRQQYELRLLRSVPNARSGQSSSDQQLNCGVFVKMETPQWAAWQQHSLETRGKGTPRNERFGWYFPSEWPPSRERRAS